MHLLASQTCSRDLDRLGDEIAELSAHLDAATARLLDLIREFDARSGWGNGFRSCAEWLSWRVGLDPGVVVREVETPESLDGRLYEGLLVGGARDVAGDEARLSAQLLDQPDGLLTVGATRLEVVDDHAERALAGKRKSRGAADPAGSARDQPRLAVDQAGHPSDSRERSASDRMGATYILVASLI